MLSGAAGYVGSRLAQSLTSSGVEVHFLVRRRVSYLEGNQIVVDLARPTQGLVDIFSNMQAVIHLAGPNELVTWNSPEDSMNEASSAAWHVSQAAAAAHVPRLIYLSTAHVYGAATLPGMVVTEETSPEPRSPYSVARLNCEHIFQERAYNMAHGVTAVVCFRMTNAVGAPARPAVRRWSLVANDLSRQAALNGEIVLRTNGLQYRDFIHIEDACDILYAATDLNHLNAGIYNMASGASITILDLAKLTQIAYTLLTGKKLPLRYPTEGPTPHEPSVYSVSKLATRGLAPSRSLTDAVIETVDFCLRNRSRLT